MAKPHWTDTAPDKKLDALLSSINEACTVSETAQQVMSLTRAGEVNLTSVVDAVMKDPQLATELLRLANSPLFGQTRQVHDLKRAVVVVGMQEVHNIAAAMSMMAAFSTPDPLSKRLRDTAVLSAAVGRLLAKHYRTLDESQAFLAGLLSEIGAMACLAVDAAKYTEIWESSKDTYDARASRERERYVVQSEVIGAHVLEANRLPDAVTAAVGATDTADAELLGLVTVFARRVPPLIIKAATDNDAGAFHREIPALAADVGIPPIPNRVLLEICVQAATLAELSLRGELSLVEDDADVAPEEALRTFSDPAAFDINEIALAESEARKTHAFEMVSAAKAPPVRFVKIRRSRAGWIGGGIVLIAAAAAAVWWYFFTG